MAAVSAAEDFRSGVQAYNNGLFNRSIFYLEKSLSENPNDTQTKDWLARAYYRSGFLQNALGIWQNMIDTGKASVLLKSEVATIAARRGLGPELSQQSRFVVAHTIRGSYPQYSIFLRPSAVTAMPNGSFYVASFASNEVMVLNANGALVRQIRPGLAGFNRPFDVLAPGNGYIYVSDYGSNQIVRCTPTGGQVMRFGSTGVGPGQLLGPEYLATDGKGYIYVTDVGNARVTKFDYNGKYILSFGGPTAGFAGLGTPSGVAVFDNKVYVADNTNNDIAVFDTSGNYLETIGAGILQSPNGLSFDGNTGNLIISDKTRVLLYSTNTGSFSVIADLSGTAERIVKTVVDANGDLVAADFDASKIYVLAQYDQMYSGLAVQIDRVYSEKFPKVTLDVSVESRLGRPFVGLEGSNFTVTEGGYPVADPRLVYTGMEAPANISLLIDHSAVMASHKQDIQNAATAILTALSGHGQAHIISAGEKPVVEAGPDTPINQAALIAANNGNYTDRWRFDLGLRLATSELIPKQGKSAVIFVTQGNLGARPFGQYSPSELLQFMQVNGIRLYTIYVDPAAAISRELQYLTDQSGGASYYLYQPAGIGGIVSDILKAADGTYVLQYTSHAQPDFGRAFIPVEVEAHLFSRSGRGQSGYFAPLQF